MRHLTIFILAVVSCVFIGIECREAQFKPDLYTPVVNLKTKLDAVSGFNLTAFIDVILELIINCPLNTSQANGRIEDALNFFENSEFDKLVMDIDVQDWVENIELYMKGPHYKIIHDHLWNDNEWNDMIELFYYAKWNGDEGIDNNVYNWFKKIYDFFKCPLELPTKPRSPIISETNPQQSRPQREISNYYEHPFLRQLMDIQAEKPKCNILEILLKLLQLNILGIADLFKFVIQETNSNPSIHLLWAKLSEPAKGVSFRQTRLLPEVKYLIIHWNQQLLSSPLMQLLISLIEVLLGIDFESLDINLVDLIVSLAEFLVWRTPFPDPFIF